MKTKPLHTDHFPTTRRQFLAQGLIGFGAATTLPSALGLGVQEALAGACAGAPASAMIPFFVFDMAGGAALPGNFLVYDKMGDLLPSYNKLGWDPKANGALYNDFGLPMANATISQLLKGILDNSSADARKNLRMGSFCHFAQDDSSGNKLNAATLAILAGNRGQYVATGMGIVKRDSGGNSDSALKDLALKPTAVTSINDVLGAARFGGAAYTQMTRNQLKALATSALKLGQIQNQLFLGQPKGDVLKDLSECAYEKSLQFLDGSGALDPRQNATTRAVYNINANTPVTDANAVAAALTTATITGLAGPSVWTLGGCDYHTNNQADGDRQDGLMGVQIGRAVELAHRLQKPFFFQLITDGGCEGAVGTRKWRSDSGDKCMTVVGYYNPKGPQKMLRQQVGYYTSGQGAERSTLLGANPQLVAYASFANYLQVSGKIEKFHQYLPDIFKEPGQLESVLIFEPPAKS